jgi:Tripartite tricarboxylate transporter TctB family
VDVEPKNAGQNAGDDVNNHAIWKRPVPRGMRVELVLESILIGIVTGYFTYLLLAVGGLRPEAARLPRMTAIGGLVLVAAFIAQKVWGAAHGKQNTTAQILDTGFDEAGLSGRLVVIRTLRLTTWFGAMLAAIWFVGYHVAVPAFVFLYLLAFGKTKWWTAAIAGATFFLLIYVLFDLVLHTEWPEPALLRWLS